MGENVSIYAPSTWHATDSSKWVLLLGLGFELIFSYFIHMHEPRHFDYRVPRLGLDTEVGITFDVSIYAPIAWHAISPSNWVLSLGFGFKLTNSFIRLLYPRELG